MPEPREATAFAEDFAPLGAVSVAPRPTQPPRLSGRNRYSHFVGLMKVLLPAMAAALILLVFAWPQISSKDSRFRLGMARLSLDQADSLTMLNARYDGVDASSQPFSVTADMATQSRQDDDLVHLELPKADMTADDGAWLALTARTGAYHRAAEMLDLTGSVSLFHDKGVEMSTESARIDLRNGTAEGRQPVEGQGVFGTIDAEGFRVLDRGQTIIFTGKSRLILYSGAQQALQ